MYRHVDVLRAHGFDAFISHHVEGFRCSWFENTTPILYPPQCYPRVFDILVAPEIYSWDLSRQTPGVPKVVFKQNAYQTFDWVTPETKDDPAPYTRVDVVASIVVSEDNRQYLQYAFTNHRVMRIRYSVDGNVFRYESRKRLQIAYMPRKLPYDATQVLEILEARGALAGVNVVKIEDMTEAQTAAVLRESLIFLSFAVEEGWSLPPMEAMASGCAVVATNVRGIPDYAISGVTALTAEPHDPPALARHLVALARDPALRSRIARAGRAHIEGFSWPRATGELETILRGIASGRTAQ